MRGRHVQQAPRDDVDALLEQQGREAALGGAIGLQRVLVGIDRARRHERVRPWETTAPLIPESERYTPRADSENKYV